MTDRERKRAAVKALEADFVKRFRVVIAPMVTAIKTQLLARKTAHQAVDHVFREHNIRGHLKRLVVNSAVKAVKHG